MNCNSRIELCLVCVKISRVNATKRVTAQHQSSAVEYIDCYGFKVLTISYENLIKVDSSEQLSVSLLANAMQKELEEA